MVWLGSGSKTCESHTVLFGAVAVLPLIVTRVLPLPPSTATRPCQNKLWPVLPAPHHRPTWRQACRIIVALVGSEQHHLLLLHHSCHLTSPPPPSHSPPVKACLHAPVIPTTVPWPGFVFLFGVRLVSYKPVRPRIATSASQPRTTASLTLAFGFLKNRPYLSCRTVSFPFLRLYRVTS